MNITIKTATVTIDDKTVPLTKAIVQQIPIGHRYMQNDHFKKGGGCQVLGEVEYREDGQISRYILISTPEGVRKVYEDCKNALNVLLREEYGTQVEKIILIK